MRIQTIVCVNVWLWLAGLVTYLGTIAFVGAVVLPNIWAWLAVEVVAMLSYTIPIGCWQDHKNWSWRIGWPK